MRFDVAREARPDPDIRDAVGLRILIVDDDPVLSETFRRVLESRQYVVASSNNGVDALKYLLDHDVDAVLCDLVMPSMHGDTLYRAVCRVKPFLRSRFVFITGHPYETGFEQIVRKEGPIVLHKPLTPDQLFEALDRMKLRFESSGTSTRGA